MSTVALEWLGDTMAALAVARDLDEVLERSLVAVSALVNAKQAYAFIERQGHVDEPISIYKSAPVVSDAETREIASKSNYSSPQPRWLGDDAYCFPFRSRGRSLGAIVLCGSRLGDEQRLALHLVAAHTAIVLDNLILCRNEWTRLPNLSAMRPILTQALGEAKGPVALFFVDIDDFKGVNSKVGYFGGAELLIQFASRLTQCPMLEAGWLGHISGDEFLFVLPLTAGDTKRLRETARTIKETVYSPFVIQRQRLAVTVSIGISIHPHDARTVDELLTHSGRAALDAKRAGKNAYRVFRARARQ